MHVYLEIPFSEISSLDLKVNILSFGLPSIILEKDMVRQPATRFSSFFENVVKLHYVANKMFQLMLLCTFIVKLHIFWI